MSFVRKTALILGLGVSGRSMASYLLKKGYQIICLDKHAKKLEQDPSVRELLKEGIQLFEEGTPLDLRQFDFIIPSPGIPQNHPELNLSRSLNLPIVNEVELACQLLMQLSNPPKIFGITGTNGKTTVTLLVEHVLNHCNKKCLALGNVGKALISQVDNVSLINYISLELSSFQLEMMKCEALNAAVLLNVTPDHLDRYVTMEDYAKTKINISDCLKFKELFYVEENTAKEWASLLKGKPYKTYGFSPHSNLRSDLSFVFCDQKQIGELPLELKGLQSHDVVNFLASFALVKEAGISYPEFLEAYALFQKPPHRIEFVREVRGVSYINDSKGTNLDAVIKAVSSINSEVILIAGGVHKGSSYLPWIEAFTGKVKQICAIGEAARQIEIELSHAIPVNRFLNLEEAVKFASSHAVRGDTVLLSPGCSSYDMFKDYAHRGEEFKKFVRKL